MMDFLSQSIKEKEEHLECPVCLETAEAPIYMCQEMNLIWCKASHRVNIALSNTVKRGTSRSAINGKLQQAITTFSGMYHVYFVRVTKLPAS